MTRRAELARGGGGTLDISIIGGGHVGLVTAAAFAAIGHRVRVLDIDAGRVQRLSAGESPFFEPGLDALLSAARPAGSISFSTDPDQSLGGSSLVFLCVNTPNTDEGQVDLSAVVSAAGTAARHASDGAVVVNRSTSPVGTAEYVRSILEERRGDALRVAVNPEFLAEGTAVRDFLFPDRIVVGSWSRTEADVVLEAYAPIVAREVSRDVPSEVVPPGGWPPVPVPVIVTSPPTAELIKYAANAFLAVKISFINEMAQVAEEVGGDVTEVSRALGLDRRIGPQFLRAGIGWGGSCFPKDIVALQGMAETRGLAARILRAANDVNVEQQRWVIRRLQRHMKTLVGRRIALLGLTFKPNTDDLRNAPALEIAYELSRMNARVRAFDPVVKALPPHLDGVLELADDALDAASGAEAVVLVTEWPQFGELDLDALRGAMRGDLLLDGRNLLDPDAARAAGLTYIGVGR